MKKTITGWGITLLLLSGILYSCSKDDAQHPNNHFGVSKNGNKDALNFMAVLSLKQMENLEKTGAIFLPEQQRDSWRNVIPGDIPTKWGVFDSPILPHASPQAKAAGIYGSYPAQYWTMVRVKIGNIGERIRDALNSAVLEIESKTNVRFYNSQRDPEYYEPYQIKLPNVFVTYSTDNSEGSGSFGLVGGEQYIRVPRELDDASKFTDEEVSAFLMHALCNAAGMFNEQQRFDRDKYVDIYWDNIKEGSSQYFAIQNRNYTTLGNFDYNSITMASSTDYSKNGNNTITKKGGGTIARNLTLSPLDIQFLNSRYLPYIARTDNYVELDAVVYQNGRTLSESERLDLQRRINQQRGLEGDPPADGRIVRATW